MEFFRKYLLEKIICVNLLFSIGVSQAAFSFTDNCLFKGAKFVSTKAFGVIKKMGGLLVAPPKFLKKVTFGAIKNCFNNIKKLQKERNALNLQYWQARCAGNRLLQIKYQICIKIKTAQLIARIQQLFVIVYGLFFICMIPIVFSVKFFKRKYVCQFCGNYLFKCTCGARDKLRHACSRNLSLTRIKKIIESVKDINEDIHNYRYENPRGSLLHHVVYYGDSMLPIVKWMVEQKYANIFVPDNRNRIPRQVASRQISDYLLDMENKHYDLSAKVIDLDNHLVQGNYLDIQEVKDEFEKIKQCIIAEGVTGYTKQFVMPSLVKLCKNYPNIVSKDDLKELYKHIAFNYAFLHRKEWSEAVRFAIQEHLVDKNDRTVLVAYAVHSGSDNCQRYLFEKNWQFYRQERLFKDWLVEQSNPGGWSRMFTCFKRDRKSDEVYDIKEDYKRALDVAKKHGKKSLFRELANRSAFMDNVKQIEQNALPGEVVANIVGFMGDDFDSPLVQV